MWPKNFSFFHDFMRDLGTLLIFNTLKNKPDGMTYYDLKQYGNIPHSKIYRLMKKLEEDGDLVRKDASPEESGRPKHLYFLSEQGEHKSKGLQIKLGKFFEFIKLRFPESSQDFDHETFLQGSTFKVWCSPVEHVLQSNMKDDEKLQALEALESDVSQILQKIQNEKHKLEK